VNVAIVGVSQDVSFQDGSVTNVVTFLLPDGGHIQAVVTDEGFQHILRARGVAVPPPAHSPPPTPSPIFQSPPPATSDVDRTFGGDFSGDGEEDAVPEEGSASPAWVPDAQARPKAPPVVVAVDDRGNPLPVGSDDDDPLGEGFDEEDDL
jgi:hypothetical protein